MEDKKIVVSQFEFAITEIVDPEAAKKMRPITRAEENEERERRARYFLSRIKVKDRKDICPKCGKELGEPESYDPDSPDGLMIIQCYCGFQKFA